ncbi:hypothetical protein CA223_05520 [Sphingomonas koreensis]|uniref:Uncharacterized protein n=1 Tax=Sphingomonas koreensis TaxID=93064 RepID=A0A1L6JD04_9SPHN|nr:hypothetical protein [Sphingomonas koreensis]APR53370.1 hypothetical protein BRX40_13875 [Sphingomonas koreensis]RSU24507.1 hypothetical protein CA224_01965 [Sphingomonas koreensis]RSU30173.1 hypothetical protein CA225_05795 [Sphingomonas koreensis]RSU42305.1 hypothetical protein CA223_05520 [Sphingomonas koreensis]RSU84104.1 hypothetical protein DAH53_05430 [Sphingomonas koreensis]
MKGADGVVQIDGEFYNLALVNKVVTNAATTAPPEFDAFLVSLTVTSPDYPIVGVACDTAFIALAFVNQTGSTWTFSYYSSSAGAEVTFYVFGPPTVITTPGWGIRLRKKGVIKYDSRHNYLVEAGLFESPPGLGDATAAMPGGRSYAAIQDRRAGTYNFNQEELGAGTGQWGEFTMRTLYGLRIAANQVHGTLITTINSYKAIADPGIPLTIETTWPDFTVAVIDVTGF